MDPIEAAMAGNSPGNGRRTLLIAILIVAGAATGFTWLMRQSVGPTSSFIGRPAPAIEADGWINGPGPKPDDLKGKVIVLDAWAFWCGPCFAAAPELVELHERYRDRGVVFLGLTSEGERDLENSRQFIKAAGITWPNGYGARKTLADLDADTIPRMWVINRKNQIIWDVSRMRFESIETAIARALAEPQ